MRKYTIDKERLRGTPMAEAYVSNGFIGLRYAPDTLHPRKPAQLSGFNGRSRMNSEGLSPLPAPEFSFYLGGEAAQECFESQTYDFSNAELTTEFTLSTESGRRAALTHHIYASRTLPSLLVNTLTVTGLTDEAEGEEKGAYVNALAGEIGLDIVFDRHDRNVRLIDAETYYADDADIVSLWSGESYPDDVVSTAGIAMRSYVKGGKMTSGICGVEGRLSRGRILCRTSGKPENRGGTLTFLVYTSYVPSVLHSEPQLQAIRELKLAAWNGSATLLAKNRAAWEKLWESRVVIEADDPKFQEVTDASYFYLMTSLHPSSPSSIGPYALSSFGYYGHAFWDTESFMFMIPLLTDHSIAENLLNYRFDRLGAAKRNAKLNGFRGAQFPWQSGLTGDEVCPAWAGQAGGAGEQHINLDVAMAFVAYSRVSGDDIFIKEKAWPVLREVADWIVSRVEKTPRGYEILHVCGIDESSDNVPNDSYTNIMSAAVLRAACEFAVTAGCEPRSEWSQIAQEMFIPLNREYGFVEQYEGAPVSEHMKSESLMAFFPYGYSYSPEIDERTIRFFCAHGLMDGLNLPMLSNFLGVFPARVGDRAMSRKFYDYVCDNYFLDAFMCSTESSRPLECIKNGNMPNTIFMTARGSFLCGVMMGLTGMNFWNGGDAESWFRQDVSLPEGWKSVTLSKISVRGKAARIVARQGERARLEWLD